MDDWNGDAMTKLLRDVPRRCCVRCHFLVAEREVTPSLLERDQELTWGERRSLLTSQDFLRELRLERVYCYKSVWGDSHYPVDSDEKEFMERIPGGLREDCGETCFFLPYRKTMSLETAAKLERREADRREAKRDRRLVIIAGAIGAAVGAIIVSVLTAMLT